MSHPKIYEINTRVWLKQLSEKLGEDITLGNIPQQEWQKVKNLGCDWVWLMGVWQKSLISQELARKDPNLITEYGRVLPDWSSSDVVGSPYAVKDYSPNYELGNFTDLENLKRCLNSRGFKLLLDFVPNHTAWDHHWVWEHPDYYILQSAQNPKTNSSVNGQFIAFGKDPNYDGWNDTAQLNYFNPETREAMIGELLKIAAYCDGVRCDMAMLINNDIFAKTWEKEIKEGGWQKPESEFWMEAIARVKTRYPQFIFIAEAYWGQEEYLQSLGFDYTYDKTLYDMLLDYNSQNILNYLRSIKNPEKYLHFIENHDEARAIKAFGEDKSKAATLICATLPGANLLHQGQEKGETIKTPVQIIRKPEEAENVALAKFYRKVRRVLDEIPFDGNWELVNIEGWPDNSSYQNLISYQWIRDNRRAIIVVNYSTAQASGKVRIDLPSTQSKVDLYELLNDARYHYEVGKINNEGLFVDLMPWNAHVFKI